MAIRISRFSDHLPKFTLEVSGSYSDESATKLMAELDNLCIGGTNQLFYNVLFGTLGQLGIIKELLPDERYDLDYYFGEVRIIKHFEKDVKVFIVDVPVVSILGSDGEASDLNPVSLGYAPSDDLCASFGDHVRFFSDLEFGTAFHIAMLEAKKDMLNVRFTEDVRASYEIHAAKGFADSEFELG